MAEYKNFIKAVVSAGVTMVQLREKSTDIDEVRCKALALQSMLKPMNIPLIINDFVELAVEIDASGVHIGQQDMSVTNARQILGANKIIGWSIESMEDLHQANDMEALSYVSASAVFPSQTKPSCKTIWGLEGLKCIVQASKHPVVAIGGIQHNNVSAVMDTGVCGIAAIGAFHNALDPFMATQHLIKRMHAQIAYD